MKRMLASFFAVALLAACAAALGYRPGDEVPTKRYSDEHPDRTVYFLKPSTKDLRTPNSSDWVPQRR